MTKKIFEVWGVIGGSWEYQGCWLTREDAERIERIIKDGYNQVVIRETDR